MDAGPTPGYANDRGVSPGLEGDPVVQKFLVGIVFRIPLQVSGSLDDNSLSLPMRASYRISAPAIARLRCKTVQCLKPSDMYVYAFELGIVFVAVFFGFGMFL
jgi:hypothetical protein